ARKLLVGMVAGLQDPAVLDGKRAAEKALRERVGQDRGLAERYASAWGQVEKSAGAMRKLYKPYQLLEGAGRGLGNPWAFDSTLFHLARTLVRHAQEKDRPNARRLREYQDANLDSLKRLLFSPAPIHADFEAVKLADSLGLLAEARGADDTLVKEVLAGKAPAARAAELVRGTKLQGVAERRRLFE